MCSQKAWMGKAQMLPEKRQKGIGRLTMEKLFRNSYCFGVLFKVNGCTGAACPGTSYRED